ncbi:replication-associated protein [Pacific flying fox faeces associated circular DNA virus-3]|uniref:Replication-associated protein n=1 Tax=Pacific flying fox faeces associated circular DNA virus-3 TaxID=1796012 RepID=A0A140CTT0_9VIRU|nr:replication-associated protein [Pacific flying fox faeces associated circular DNA virus-3]
MPKRIRQPRRRRWVFTLNNFTEEELTTIKNILTDLAPTYAIIGKEVGECGTPHLQGFVSLKKQISFTAMKSLIGTRAHIEAANGTDVDNQLYCSKQDADAWQLGEPRQSVTGRGGNALDYRGVLEALQSGSTVTEIVKNPDLVVPLIIQHRNLRQVLLDLKKEKELEKLRTAYKNVTLRPFQEELVNILSSDPDSRAVYWYYDQYGNTGKTWFSKYLVARMDALRLENGKTADLKHAYEGQKIVIFDFSRSTMERINYECIEAIKNGLVFSGKYESTSKIFPVPHVVCFANCPPDTSKLSYDRWRIRCIDEINISVGGTYQMRWVRGGSRLRRSRPAFLI